MFAGKLTMPMGLAAALAASGAIGGSPAVADVKDGVDAWSRGEYALAVGEWREPAKAGDADALFNLAQAYRLGRGVDQNTGEAEKYYAQAAAKGHVKAADIYGLMLFQDPARRQQALPYVADAAGRGDPRSQYLLGIAHFNGDMVDKDWVRAYALLTLANGQGLPQAAPAISQMDQHIPLPQRQQAQSLAIEMQARADAARATEMAAVDLAMGGEVTAQAADPVAVAAAAPQRATTAAPAPRVATAAARVPQALPQTSVPPSVLAARSAVQQAMQVTGTESPSAAGADYTRTAGSAAPAAAVQTAPPAAPVRVAAAPPPPPPPSARAPARDLTSGSWKVQLGAFSVAGNAEKLWSRLSSRPELAGRSKLLEPAGRVTKLLAGGYASKAQADSACAALKRSGQDCLVTSR